MPTPVKPLVPRPAAVRPLPTAEEVPAPEPLFAFTPPVVATQPATAAAPQKPKSPNTLLIAGGGIAAAVVILAVVFFVANPLGGGSNKTVVKKPDAEKAGSKKEGTLALDWPEADRSNAKLTVDGRTMTVNPTGPVEVALKPGSHRVAIMRRSYEPVNVEIEVPAGGRAEFSPAFKAVDSAQTASNNTPTTPAVKPVEGSGFQIGGAVVPVGFEGWEQLFVRAKTRAAQEHKDILLVFGSSDGSPATASLADGLKAAGLPNGALGKQYVPVILDFPTTADGYNRVNDRRQNIELAQDFRIRDLEEGPTVVLTDDKGRPYAIEREVSDPQPTELLAKLNAQKGERDRLLAAAGQGGPTEMLAGAAAVAEWIQNQHFAAFYKEDIQKWLATAKQLDPENAQGGLEALVECDLFGRLAKVDPRNRVEFVRMLSEVDAWLKRKFVNPDRGARVHLLAGGILSEFGSEQKGREHFQKAATYAPKDPELAEQIKGLKQALAHSNVLSTGTGFVVASGGYLLTNRHVIAGRGTLAVRVPGIKDPVPAAVVKEHPERDIALVKAKFPADFDPTPVAVVAGEINRGLEVAAFGFPAGDVLGQSLKFTKGAISDLPNEVNENMMLLDLRVNPGNSGGPLCDGSGGVVGMITAKTNAEGLDTYGLAIPAAELDAFLTDALPPDAKRAPPGPSTAKTWDKVDKQVSPAVLMLIKTR